MKTDKQREGSFETERVKSLPPGSVQTLGQNYNEREREKNALAGGVSLSCWWVLCEEGVLD